MLALYGCGNSEPPTVAPPPPPPLPPAVPQAVAPVRPNPAARPAARPLPLPEIDPPGTHVVGIAAANYDAQASALRFSEAEYDALIPTVGEDSRHLLASTPQRPPAITRPPVPFMPPDGFTVLTEAGFNPQGLPLRLRCTLDGSDSALIPAGVFVQGRDDATGEAGPAHPVYIDACYMDLFEVTVARYLRFRQDNLTTRRPQPPVNPDDPPDHPALGVNWRDAANYARWVGKELPTEAEWEKAARGEQGFEFPWGNDRAIWSRPRNPGQIDAVGSFAGDRSVYGVFDLAGNAREWCHDWYAPDTYAQSRTPDGSPPRNPTGAEKAVPPNARVIKGSGSTGWRLWARDGVSMRESLPDVGFRCVLRIALPVNGPPAP